MSQEIKFKLGPGGRLVEVKLPGRPKKASRTAWVGDGLSVRELARLTKDLALVPEVAKLSTVAQAQLIEELGGRLAYFKLVQPAMAASPPQGRGNRRKLETQALIWDCAQAIKKVTGMTAPIWSSPAANSESTAVKVARVCLGVLVGAPGPFQGNLRRQAELAAKLR